MLLLTSWAAAALLAAPHPVGPTPALLDSLVAAKMREWDVPGLTLAVVQNGADVLLRGYGVADVRTGRPVDPQRTVFRIASVSKLFVATSVMQLAERGTLDLHADVNRYLRAFQLPATYAEPVALEHLLTHTAGFDERVIGYAARDLASVRPLGEYLAARMPPRTTAPGQLTSYSNHGVALAAYVVESAAAVPFAEYVGSRILAPLGVTAAADGELTVTGIGPGARRFVEVDSLLYREVAGEGRIAFRRDERGHVTHLFGPQSFMGAEFPGAYERLAWYDTPHVVNELLSYTAMVPLLVLLIGWPLAAGAGALVVRRRRRVGGLTAGGRAPSGAFRGRSAALGVAVAALFAALYAVFCFRFIAVSVRMAGRGGGELVYGMPPSMASLTWMPAAIAVLAVALVAWTVWALRTHAWSLLGRIFYSSIAVDACVVVALLVRWGYLPLRY